MNTKTKNNMTLNEYQEKAMATCMPSCKNEIYAINGLMAEVGEINDKIAKGVRKGFLRIDNNRLVWNTTSEEDVAEYRKGLILEAGDCLWMLALLSRQLGYTLDEMAMANIEKLRDRATRGVIDGEGDHR